MEVKDNIIWIESLDRIILKIDPLDSKTLSVVYLRDQSNLMSIIRSFIIWRWPTVEHNTPTQINAHTHTLYWFLGILWTRFSLVSFHRKPLAHLQMFQSHSFNYTLCVKSLIALMSILIVPSSTCDTKNVVLSGLNFPLKIVCGNCYEMWEMAF